MTEIECILCLKEIRRNVPISLTSLVSEKMSLEDCIKERFPFLNSVINRNTTFTCTTCYKKFVDYHDFLQSVEYNYGSNHVEIKVEPFLEVSAINYISPLLDQKPIILRECSVILTRCELPERQDEQHPVESDISVKSEFSDDSDFEWPDTDELLSANDDDKIPKKSIAKKPKVQQKKSWVARTQKEAENEQRISESVEMKCHECGLEMESFMGMKRHFQKCHPEIKGYLKCHCGDRKFFRRYELIDHLDTHSEERLECELCNNGVTFKSRKILLQHQQRAHSKIRTTNSLICDYCGKICTNSTTLRYHLDKHDSSRSYECYICKTRLCSFLNVKYHMIKKHRHKKVSCPHCSKTFEKPYLNIHIQNRHSTEKKKRIKCTKCDCWLLERSMAAHMRKHYEEMNGSAVCKECGFITTNRKALNQHILIRHNSANWKYSCDQCGKRFYDRRYLMEHIAVHHTREFLYDCRVCGKQFRNRTSWKKHEGKSHRHNKCENGLKSSNKYDEYDDNSMIDEQADIDKYL